MAAVYATTLCLAVPGVASALPPHVAETSTTDACAICHRTHSATGGPGWRTFGLLSRQGQSLLLSGEPTAADWPVCYRCHGVGSLGSSVDVETSMALASRHSMSTTGVAWRAGSFQCGDCHDAHGQDRTLAGTPYPRLLRAWMDTTTIVLSGIEYCASCHDSHLVGRWSGSGVYRDTRHFYAMPAPGSGTGVSCSNCHAPHGSDATPLITPQVRPPAVAEATSVAGNDRRLCAPCHATAFGTWSGPATYAPSAHALSVATVAVDAEWASTDTSRAVGECQACHAPMGVDDGSGRAIPKLLAATGRRLCDSCHDADGPASTDVSSTAYPMSEASALELIVGWRPSADTSAYGRLAVYSRDTTGTAPRRIVGPREFAATGAPGPVTVGDIDGDTVREVVVADRAEPKVTVFSRDPLLGISSWATPGVLALPGGRPAGLIALADFTEIGADAIGRPELAVVDAAGSALVFYRLDLSGSALTTVGGPFALGAGPYGLAFGDATATVHSDAVVTAAGADRVYLATDPTGSGGMSVTSFASTQPVGPSVGDAWERPAGTKSEIVVADRTTAALSVAVFDGSGALLGLATASTGTIAAARPTATAIGDVLPSYPGGSSGREIAVALEATATGDSLVNVFMQSLTATGPGWVATPQVVYTGDGYGTRALLAGDVEGDGTAELVAGNGGVWSRVATPTAASLQVFRADGSGLALASVPATTLPAGGAELSGGTPSLVLTDLGAIVPSRHPVDVVTSHVSTESAPFARHVTCSDCHDSHEATNAASVAPSGPGALLGARGVPVTNVSTSSVTYGSVGRTSYGYEVCFKCHSGYTALSGRRDLGRELNALNPSVHAVETSSLTASNTADSFVAAAPSRTSTTVLGCGECHADSVAANPAGTHRSDAAPILRRPYLGVTASTADLVCYLCHKRTVYYTGADDSGSSRSMFSDAPPATSTLHAAHVVRHGLGCAACHVSHGSPTSPHLVSDAVGYSHSTGGGACTTACHIGAGWRGYARRSAAATVTAVDAAIVTGSSAGTFTSTWAADGVTWDIARAGGAIDVRLTMGPAMTRPTRVGMRARMLAPGDSITVYVYDRYGANWDAVGAVNSDVLTDYAFAVDDSRYVSDGEMLVRIAGSPASDLSLDQVWAEH